jgi:hypothetical protein
MSVIQALMQHNRLRAGTWLGLSTNGQQVIRRVRVSSLSDGYLWAVDHTTNSEVVINPQSVIEIDGMAISRWLSQADLDKEGHPVNQGKKRGRRSKRTQA